MYVFLLGEETAEALVSEFEEQQLMSMEPMSLQLPKLLESVPEWKLELEL